MTVAAPPRPPRLDEPEALFEEARQHRRQRRLRALVIALVVLAGGGGAYAVLDGGTTHSASGQSGNRAAAPGGETTVVLLVDISGSMRASDIGPTRLEATVAAMKSLVERLPSRVEVGLVTFSSTAQ